ncbi:hypothetical protein D5086_012667 [Populus alba]|uniref:Uncharacterized protein n=1 Tax=Populus alba TaxID=43335 RepID=A0ACC4C4C8_POPAL
MEDSLRQSSLLGFSSKDRKRRRNGCESIEDTLARWKNHNKPQESKVPGKGSKKGCMKGKGGPENMSCRYRAARAYDYAAKLMYGPNAILNFPDYSVESGDHLDNMSSSITATETSSTESRTALDSNEDNKVDKLKMNHCGSREGNNQSGFSRICAVDESEVVKYRVAESSARELKAVEWNLTGDWKSSHHIEAEAPVLREEMDGELAGILRSWGCYGINNRYGILQNETEKVKHKKLKNEVVESSMSTTLNECVDSDYDMRTDHKPIYDVEKPLTREAAAGEEKAGAADHLQNGRPSGVSCPLQTPSTNLPGSLSYFQEADTGLGWNFDLSQQDFNGGLVGEPGLLDQWYPELHFQ